MSLRHSVIVPSEEERLLAALVGRPLDLVRVDALEVEVVSGDLHLRFSVEEVPTPDERNPWADAHRVVISQPDWELHEERERWADLGTVVEVARLRARVSTTLPGDAGPIQIDSELRPTTGWDRVYLAADEEPEPGLPLITVDIAVEVVTDRGRRGLIYTYGVTNFIGIAVDSEADADADWTGAAERLVVAPAASA